MVIRLLWSSCKSVFQNIFHLIKTLILVFFFFCRTRNDGLFAKANCSAVATIRELPSSKENRGSSNNDLSRHNSSSAHGVKSGQTVARMIVDTCDGHTPRHRAPLPPVKVRFFWKSLQYPSFQLNGPWTITCKEDRNRIFFLIVGNSFNHMSSLYAIYHYISCRLSVPHCLIRVQNKQFRCQVSSITVGLFQSNSVFRHRNQWSV